jgi:hypothetical protein
MKPLLPIAAALSLLALVAAAGLAEPDARVLVDKAVKAAGGADTLPGYFTFKDRVLIGETDTGFGAKRESVLDAPRSWWLKKPGGYSQREKEPATFLVWAWTLRALTDASSTIAAIPAVKDGDAELWGLRVSGSITPPMELYFAKTNDLLARIDWRSDIHRFSNWKTTASGFTYPARVVGHKKATGKIWYFDDVLEVTPLKELPERLREAK